MSDMTMQTRGAEESGDSVVAAIRKINHDDAAGAIAKATGTPSFTDHSQGFAAALKAEEEKLRRARGTLGDRRAAFEDQHKKAIDELEAQRRTAAAEFDAEQHDIERAYLALQAAASSLAS